jgi:hypothetical protein
VLIEDSSDEEDAFMESQLLKSAKKARLRSRSPSRRSPSVLARPQASDAAAERIEAVVPISQLPSHASSRKTLVLQGSEWEMPPDDSLDDDQPLELEDDFADEGDIIRVFDPNSENITSGLFSCPVCSMIFDDGDGVSVQVAQLNVSQLIRIYCSPGFSDPHK